MPSRNSYPATDEPEQIHPPMKHIDRRTGKMLGIAASAIAVILFLLVSNNLIKELENQERDRMNIWAQATERLAKANIDSDFEIGRAHV